MAIAARHDELLRLLRMRADWRTADLADELGVSVRTVWRDLDRLRDRGFEISTMSGPGGGVHLEPTSVLVTSQLDGDEVVSLVLSVAMAQAVPWMPFAAGATAALAKIEASLPRQRAEQVQALMMRILIGPPARERARDRSPSPLLARLFELAFREGRLLSFEYRDRAGTTSRRVVEPHGLLVRAPRWYVIAWDVEIDELRLFRADRIRSPHVRTATFLPRPHDVVRRVAADARPIRDSRI
ncbi:MAG: WYL domain-containing protein [Actinomycetota bacterium]